MRKTIENRGEFVGKLWVYGGQKNHLSSQLQQPINSYTRFYSVKPGVIPGLFHDLSGLFSFGQLIVLLPFHTIYNNKLQEYIHIVTNRREVLIT